MTEPGDDANQQPHPPADAPTPPQPNSPPAEPTDPANTEQLHPDIHELAHIIGDDLLAFMLANPPHNPDAGPETPTDNQRTAVLQDIWTTAIAHTEENPGGYHRWSPLPTNTLIELFCTYNTRLGTTRATHWHIQSGGQRPDLHTSDPTSLEECLQVVAIDCFSARLIGDGRQHNSPSSTKTHPLRVKVREMLVDDAEITALYRTATATSDTVAQRHASAFPNSGQMEVYWSTGGGGSLSLRDVGDRILESVVLDADLDDRVLPRVAEAVRENLTRARQLASGESTYVTVLVGLGNVTLADDVGPIPLLRGQLRRPTVLDLRANPFTNKPTAILEIEQSLKHTDAQLSPLPILDETRQQSLQRFIADNERRKQYLPELIAAAEALQEDIRRVRFAMVLSSPDTAILSPTWLFSRQYNPLTFGGSNSHQPAGWNEAGTDTVTIDVAAAASIGEWTSKMSDLPDSLKIGRRRLLQAVTERYDATDRFIDAVVAWESMFGAPNDSALRVTGSIALILEPTDIDARAALFKNLNLHYVRRSDLVHGAVGPDKETKSFKIADVPHYAQQAIRYAIESYKHILDNPRLVPLESPARSKRILLGI